LTGGGPTPRIRNYGSGRLLRHAARVLGTGSLLAPQDWSHFPAGGRLGRSGSPDRYPRPDDGAFRLAEPVPCGTLPLTGRGSSPSRGGSPAGPESHRARQRRVAAVAIARLQAGITQPLVHQGLHQTRVATSTVGSACASERVVHSRALAQQVTRALPNQIGRLPEEFLWLVLTSRGRPHTSYPAEPGRGVEPFAGGF